MTDRREFLRKSAAVSAVGFVLPMIVTVSPAAASALTSPPPGPPDQPTPVPEPTPEPKEKPGRDELALTGVNIAGLSAAGFAAAAGGAALTVWSADGSSTAGIIEDGTTKT